GALTNPLGQVMGCRPVAELWAGLEQEQDPAVISERLERFYFDGLPGAGMPDFLPVVDPIHLGLDAAHADGYHHSGGQVRLSQHMQDPWELREFHIGVDFDGNGAPVSLMPATVKNNPLPGLFDPAAASTERAISFRGTLVNMTDAQHLAATSLTDI